MRLLLILTILFFGFIANCQNKITDLSYFSQENIEYTALKDIFYIIRQEYVIMDKDQNPRTRGNNNFYGKAYAIGVLDEDFRLWFPTFVRRPWDYDQTFDKNNLQKGTPKCTVIKVKGTNEDKYFETQLENIPEKKLITSISRGMGGLELEKDTINKGTLIVFSTSNASPDNFDLISHSIIQLSDIEWDSNQNSETIDLSFGSEKILGGVFFSRKIEMGLIEWKLSSLLVPLNTGEWILKAIQ
jgi:hypothetical protein